MRIFSYFIFLLVICPWIRADTTPKKPQSTVFVHGLSRHGEPALPPGFQHYRYADPAALKGGVLRVTALGSFDTFHTYGPTGKSPWGMHYVYETLLVRNWDEPQSKYGVLSEKVELSKDNRWVAFHINPKARFHDGTPITAQDVVFSFNTITTKGSLFWQQFYQDVESVTATSSHRVLFTFRHNNNQELALILGQLPVLPSHWWQNRDFTKASLEIPMGSGPYTIKRFKQGQFIEYGRVENYWAKNHPVNNGRYNFDVVRYDFYRDDNSALQSLNSGTSNWRLEGDPRFWTEAYNQKKLASGELKTLVHNNQNPQTLSLVFNTRKEKLQDIRIREAITVLLDIDWAINNLLQGSAARALSLFAGTEMATIGVPLQSEQALLKDISGDIPERVFRQSWPPLHKQPWRERLRYAHSLFKQAGLSLKQGMLTQNNGQPFQLTLLLGNTQYERVAQTLVKRFKDAGVNIKLQLMESTQYQKTIRDYNFDMILHTFGHTPSPGVEQKSYWGGKDASNSGSLNFSGIDSQIVNQLIDRVITARTHAELVTASKAMDRVLLWQFAAVPLLYRPDWQIVHHRSLKYPKNLPRFVIDRSTWWHEPESASTGKNK